jgi:hypothetical protein
MGVEVKVSGKQTANSAKTLPAVEEQTTRTRASYYTMLKDTRT